jgi:hypothetical protein
MSHLNTAYKLGSIQAQVEFEDWLRKQGVALPPMTPAPRMPGSATPPPAPSGPVNPGANAGWAPFKPTAIPRSK